MPSIPPELSSSAALQLVVSQGWNFRFVTPPKIEIEICPSCNKGGYHAWMLVHAKDDQEASRDGLYGCVRCNKGGNLIQLKQKLGILIPGVEGRKEQAGKDTEPLPNVEILHDALMKDEAALEYLIQARGFSYEIIKSQKIGLKEKHFFRGVGDVRALVYPYLVNGNCVWAHYRTLPTMPLSDNKIPKAFSSPIGWDATLYNGAILLPGLKELVMVEGEPNCIAAMDKGIHNAVGVPGANFKKATWISTLDELALDKVYICYDKDKVGQTAAQDLAQRVGIEKCYKIILPDFEVVTETGETRKGKDLNEWFAQGGGTKEAFDQLKQDATLFDVQGVASSGDSLQELKDELLGKGTAAAKYKHPRWGNLNKLIGIDNGDVIDICAPAKIGKTTLALNWIEDLCAAYGEDGIFICLEMTRIKIARKLVCYKAQIEDKLAQNETEETELYDALLQAIPTVQAEYANREGELYLCYPQYKTMEDLYTLIRQVIRRYGVRFIVFDNIQRAADTTSSAKGSNRTEHLSQISKVLSQIAKDFGVVMFRIIQPKKLGRGQIATSEDVDGSSQIPKDCDGQLILHRQVVGELNAEQEEMMVGVDDTASFAKEMLIKVTLSRYSSGGKTWMLYDGGRSTISPLNELHYQAVTKKTKQHVGHANQLAAMGLGPQDEDVA